MNEVESAELGKILYEVPKIIRDELQTEQVYGVCFTEKVRHLHFHLVPRGVGEKKQGTDLLNLIEEVRTHAKRALRTKDVLGLVNTMKQRLGEGIA